MIKRAFKFIGITCALGLGVYAYLHFSAEKTPQNNFHLSFLPETANWFIEYNDALQFTQELSQITSSIGKCELNTELLSGFSALDKEKFKKATLAVSDCEMPSVAVLVETKQNLKGLSIQNWNSKKIQRGLWLFSRGIDSEVVNTNLDHLQAYLKESQKMRCISKVQTDADQPIYSIHEVNVEKGKTHLSGFVVDGTKKMNAKNVSLDPRSFSELLPDNTRSFEWSSISEESSEVTDNQLSEVVCFKMKSSNDHLVALKMKIKTQQAQETFKNSGAKIGSVGNSKWLNDMIPQMRPTTHYSLFKDWIICASSENELTEYASAISKKSWSNSKEYAHMVNNLGMNIGAVSYAQLDGGKWKMAQNAFANNGAYYNIVDIFDGSSMPISAAPVSKTEPIQDSKPIVALSEEPFEFTNHYTKAKEWVIQDEDLNLVLMTKNKEVIFKKQLDSPVMGEFKMVDALKNNKYQIAFNTENYIYLVDRKGRDVENFPIKLSSPASNELAVIDYENNENYRLIQALDNGKVENFTIGGHRVKGWKYKTVEKAVIYPITHLKLGSKDYLFTLNEDYEIQLLDRTGKVRHPLEDQPKGLDSFAFEIFEKGNIQESGIRYDSNGEQKEFVFGKGSS